MEEGYFKADILWAKALLISCKLTAVTLTYTKGWQKSFLYEQCWHYKPMDCWKILSWCLGTDILKLWSLIKKSMHHICLSELPYFTNYGQGHKTQKCNKSVAQCQDRKMYGWYQTLLPFCPSSNIPIGYK